MVLVVPSISLPSHFCLFPPRYNNGRFFLLVDGPEPVTPWKMTRNQDLNVLHVDSAAKWADSLKALQRVTGDTLVFDFVYFLHPVSAVLPWSSGLLVPLTCGVLAPRRGSCL